MEKRLAIIDPVGIKSGMNHYNNALCQSLANNKTETYVYSNYSVSDSVVEYRAFFGTFFSSKFLQLLNLLKGLILSALDCKKNKVQVAIVHVFSTHHMAFLSFLMLKLFRLKVIAISHDVSSFTNQDIPIYHHLIYNRWSNHIVVHNDFSKRQLLPRVSTSIHSKVSVIKHGSFLDIIDTSISKSSARKYLGLDANVKYLLFFGRLKATKRLDILLQAMTYIDQNTHLIIAGNPVNNNFDDYQRIINDLQISNRVFLDIGYVTDQKRDWYFQASDATVLPYEVIYQSGVLLMSMSYGLPVIASNIPPFKEVIQHQKNGLLFESLTPQDLAKKVNGLMLEEHMRLSLSESAIHTMNKDYAWQEIAKKYEALIIKI